MSSTTGRWEQVEIVGKTADVYLPAGSEAGESAAPRGQVVLHQHGHSGETLAGSRAFTAELEKHQLPAICPHGKRSWWLDRVCSEFDTELSPLRYLREQVVPYIAERWQVEPPQIGLTGISMGGQGALQLAYRYPREFPVVAAIAPAIDFHNWHGRGLPLDEMFANREAARQETAILQLTPLNWPRHQLLVCDPQDVDWFDGAERMGMKLSASGIPYEADFETSAGGHSWEYFDAMAPRVIDYVAASLEKVSRQM